MNYASVLSLGSFMLASAHYVHDSDDAIWWLLWAVVAFIYAGVARHIERVALSSTERGEKP